MAQVEVLNFPRKVVATLAAPHESTDALGPLAVRIPVLTSGKHGTVVYTPPVRNIESNRAESSPRWCPRLVNLLGDHASRPEVDYCCFCIVTRDQREIPGPLSKRLKRP